MFQNGENLISNFYFNLVIQLYLLKSQKKEANFDKPHSVILATKHTVTGTELDLV